MTSTTMLPCVLAGTALLALIGCTFETTTPQPTQTPDVLAATSQTASVSPSHVPGSATDTAAAFPTPHICRAEVVEQAYEHGRMFWVGRDFTERCREQHDFAPASGEIWVLIFDETGEAGEWLIFVDDWNSETEIPFDIRATQPPGLVQPVRGFGKVWREQLSDEQMSALGWATGPEIKFVADYRYDAGGFVDNLGTYVPRPGQHTLVSYGGERFFLDEQTGRFEVIPAS